MTLSKEAPGSSAHGSTEFIEVDGVPVELVQPY